MKPYAVVKFPINNTVGIICTKWIVQPDGKKCLYPAAKCELYNMTRILKKAKDAMPGWDEVDFIILKEFDTYEKAKKKEPKAEETSNLSTDEEENEDPKRQRKPNSRYTEFEDCGDESDGSDLAPPAKKPKPLPIMYPSLATFSPSELTIPKKSCATIYQPQQSPGRSDPLVALSEELPEVDNDKPSQSLPRQNNYFSTPSRQNSCSSTPSRQNSCTSTPSRQPQSSEQSQVIDKLNHVLVVMTELTNKLQNLDEKFEKVSSKIDKLTEASNGHGPLKTGDRAEEIISNLPITSEEDFNRFETKLEADEALRKTFVKTMSAVGGRDANCLTINILRTTLKDEVAELFSLTGKKMGNFPVKRKFIATKMCCLIFDAVRRRFKDVSNDTLKNSVKSWLQQATPRIQKRWRRLDRINESTEGQVRENETPLSEEEN